MYSEWIAVTANACGIEALGEQWWRAGQEGRRAEAFAGFMSYRGGFGGRERQYL